MRPASGVGVLFVPDGPALLHRPQFPCQSQGGFEAPSSSALLGTWAVGGVALGLGCETSPLPGRGFPVSARASVSLGRPRPSPGARTPRARVPGAQPPAAARWAGR
jgi:hypothetical protein